MKLRVKNKLIMFLFGWGRFPSYVVADHKLWRTWWKNGRLRIGTPNRGPGGEIGPF